MSMSPKKKELDKKKDENDGNVVMGKVTETNVGVEAEPRKTPITFNFAPKSASQRDVSDRAVAQKMLQKSEAHASHLATVGALLKKAAQAKAQDDPEPAPPPELLAAPLAHTQAIAPTANVAANPGDTGLGIPKQEVGKQPTESVAKVEMQVAIREDASKEAATEDTAKSELPANFQFPKGYPPPKDESDTHEFPANFQFPKGYPPPPEDSAGASAHPLFPRGYPPPPDIDPSTALLQSGITLSVPPPPPPPDLNAAAAQLLMTPGMLFPQPADLTGAFVLPPPPGPPPATTPGADAVNDFITENKIDPRAASALRALPLELQQKVVAEGEIKGTNPSAVITGRIRKVQAHAEAQAVKLAASLPPGAIGPQPPPGVAVLGPPPGPPPGAPPPPPPLSAEAAAAAHLQAAQAAQAAQVAQLAALQPGLLASLSGLGAALSANPALQAAAGLLLQPPPGPPPAP